MVLVSENEITTIFSIMNLKQHHEHPQSLSQPLLLELNFFGAKFFLSTLNKE